MIGASGSCMATIQDHNYRQTTMLGQDHPGNDIDQIQDSLGQINMILEKVLGRDFHRQVKLASLRALSMKGKELVDRIRLTLKKNSYDFTAVDMENLKILSQAINTSQAIIAKKLFRSTSAEFPATAKQQLDRAINSILTYEKVISAKQSRTSQYKESLPPVGVKGKISRRPEQTIKPDNSQMDGLSDEILMQPIFPEHLSFDYHGRTSNQLTPAAMCILDLEFLRQTGQGEIPLLRNVGTLKLLLLASAQILKGIQIYKASDAEKDKIAEFLLNDELRTFPASDRTITNEKINQIYDRVRGKILARVTPQVSCQAVRKKFGVD